MQLGKIGKSLTAALVGGALLWPASSAEKPYENIHNYSRPAMAYAAEAKPATTSGIPNETDGKQYNYPTRGPKLHYKQLPNGVNMKNVKVFDPNDYYHHVNWSDVGTSGRIKMVENGSLMKGDLADAVREAYPNIKSIEQLNGAVIKPGEEHVIFVRQWFEDFYTEKHVQPNMIWYDHSRLGGTGDLRKNMSPMAKLKRVDTGKSIHVGNTDTMRLIYTKPQPNKDRYYGTIDNVEIYTNLPDVIKDVPPGKYVLEFFDSLSGSGHPLLAKAEIIVENPNKTDPRIAMALGEKYTFQNEDMDFDLFRSDTPANIGAGLGRSRVFDLAGTVNIVIPDVLPKEIERSSIKIRLAENGVITRDIYEAQLTHEPHTWTFDTTQLENGEYGVYIDLGHTNGYILRNVRIQNQPLVASQPKE